MPGGGGKGGGGSTTVNVHNDPIDVDSTVDIVGLNDIKVTLQPSPLKTESKQELILPQPLKTESKLDSKLESKSDLTSDNKSALSIDLKPVAVDLCLNTSSKLPHGEICQPFNIHLGLTWMGAEFFGVNYAGETRTVLQDLPKKPAVEWPAQQNPGSPASKGHRHGLSPPGDSGLRVRIK